jgi:DNA-binding GntR family transcriptional regulator
MAQALSTLSPAAGGFTTKQAMVYHTLRQAILDGVLEPGQRLVIDDIAAALAVSAIPVREALGQLQSERLIETKPHVGAVVSAISKDSIRELFALLEALELVAVRAVAEKAVAADQARLRELLAELESAGNARTWDEANARFHGAIVAIAGMPLLAEFTARVLREWERLRRAAFRDRKLPDTSRAQREHRALVKAIEARDIGRLEKLVTEHNRGSLATYL